MEHSWPPAAPTGHGTGSVPVDTGAPEDPAPPDAGSGTLPSAHRTWDDPRAVTPGGRLVSGCRLLPAPMGQYQEMASMPMGLPEVTETTLNVWVPRVSKVWRNTCRPAVSDDVRRLMVLTSFPSR